MAAKILLPNEVEVRQRIVAGQQAGGLMGRDEHGAQLRFLFAGAGQKNKKGRRLRGNNHLRHQKV